MRVEHFLSILLFAATLCLGQNSETQQFTEPPPTPSPTPKPHELSTSVLTPLEYKTGPYSSLTSELQAHAHSRISVELRPGFDFLDIMLKLLQWNEQDVSQMWIRPAAHVDQASYDIHTPLGLETAVQDLLRKVRMANMEEIMDHYTFNKPPDERADMRARVREAVDSLLSSSAVIQSNGLFYPSFEQPGQYKMDLAGEVNMLRHPVVHALQKHSGIAHVEIDEHFMRDRHPAWFETWPYPRQ